MPQLVFLVSASRVSTLTRSPAHMPVALRFRAKLPRKATLWHNSREYIYTGFSSCIIWWPCIPTSTFKALPSLLYLLLFHHPTNYSSKAISGSWNTHMPTPLTFLSNKCLFIQSSAMTLFLYEASPTFPKQNVLSLLWRITRVPHHLPANTHRHTSLFISRTETRPYHFSI